MFTMTNSSSLLSSYEILLMPQDNKYLRQFSLIYHGMVCFVYSSPLFAYVQSDDVFFFFVFFPENRI